LYANSLAHHRAARRHAETTVAYKVDVDKFPSAKENLKVTEFPAVVVFKDGKEIKRVEGINKDNAREIASVLV
jgi:thioredoxin-like negative regulator of GroEL